MTSLLAQAPPKSEDELLAKVHAIQSLTFAQVASGLKLAIPQNPIQRKGWLGQALERVLGANANAAAAPDFLELGVELKTIPLAQSGKPAESTFITSIPLLNIHKSQWKNSTCYAKLKRVLWLPVEGDRKIPFATRRIGTGFLWSPSIEDEAILEADWTYLTMLISTGQLELLDARLGEYLQVRPKGSNGLSLCNGTDMEGNTIKTLPRGLYLRSKFTNQILEKHFNNHLY